MKEQLFDIIIVNYKSRDLLIRCLNSIYQFDPCLFRVFIQDNSPTDELRSLPDRFINLSITSNRRNLGYSKAFNRALFQCSAPYTICLNPDTTIKGEFFRTIYQYMEENPDVGVLGPKILNKDGTIQGSARAFPNLLTALFGRSSLLSNLFPNNPLTRANVLNFYLYGNLPKEVDWVSGACAVVRRKAIEDVGLLDERFFLYWEDADWCIRMRQKGWRVVYFPTAEVMHVVGGSSEKNKVRSVYEFHKSCFFLYRKYSKPWASYVFSPFIIAVILLRIPIVFLVHLLNIRKLLKAGFFPDNTREMYKTSAAQNIKVLRIIARLNIGGPAIHVSLLTRGLNPERFTSLLVTGSISRDEGDMSYLVEPRNVALLHIPELQREIRFIPDIKTLLKLLKLIIREKPDIVHTHTAKAGTIGRLAVILYNALFFKNVKTVHTFHGHVFQDYFGPLKSGLFLYVEKVLAKGTDAIIAISKSQRQELSETFGIAPARKIKHVNLGFDLAPFLSSSASKGEFRKEIGVDEETVLIAVIGRLVPIKNHKMFFDAAKILVDWQMGKSLKFLVIGDGELRDSLERYVDQQGLKEYVCFCGWIRDIHYAFADLDILALTSLNEGTPVSIIEAMASSVPVIATDAGGVRDLLGSLDDDAEAGKEFAVCKRGILCKINDVKSLSKGLAYLVEKNGEKSEARIQRARAFVEEQYSSSQLIHHMESIYLDLMRSCCKG
jgi:GT2 family glycosyltransferase/glycosyltransferase involved in cell wall biosynthesis